MFKYPVSWYIFVLSILEIIVKTQLTVHDSSHGFISNSRKYLDDELTIIQEELAYGLRSGKLNQNFHFHVKFYPSTLDFMERPLGVPHLQKVTLFNYDKNRSIDMTSISGSTVHFHSSFFEDKKIPPLGNTSFNVVFLGRQEGPMESSLFIHTTEGQFLKYHVKGVSIYSPYRLRPIVDIKLPLNATFSPLIYLHNPHLETIQILEIYTSGGEFHLELPSGEREGPKDIWEIGPLATKAIIRVRFHAKVEQNYTAYLRIRLNNTDEVLVVPLEIQVTSEGGIHHPQGFVNFGIGGSLDKPKTVKLSICNPFKKPVRIHSVSTASKAIKIDFDHVKLYPNLKSAKNQEQCVEIGNLTVDWKTAYTTKDYSGHIIVKYRNGKSSSNIPYYLTVLEGGIEYDSQITRYFNNDRTKKLKRSFKIRNVFSVPLRLVELSLQEDARQFFTIDNFERIVLKPREEADIFTISIKDDVHIGSIKVNSHITLVTNISSVRIPLLSYDGKLELRLPFKSKDYSLDLGLISFQTIKNVHFVLLNQNPVGIALKGIKTSVPLTRVEILGCQRDNYEFALLKSTYTNLTKCNTIKPKEYVVVKLIVQTLNEEKHLWGDVQIETQYENISVPVQFKVASGKLEIGPDRLVFDQCFPGKICSHPLRVHSTFDEPMIIENILSLPPDPRLSCKHSGHILAHTSKIVGHLYLDPNVQCNPECYLGLQDDTTAQWLKTLELADSVSEFDLNLLNMFYNRYLNQSSNGLTKWENLTLRIDTSEVRGHIFKTRVKMSWPSLLYAHNIENRSVFNFPLTQIGNTTYQNITLRNPASHNLIVQMVLESDYPNIEALKEGLPPNFLPGSLKTTKNHGFTFHESYKQQYRDFMDTVLINKVGESSVPILIKPGENHTLSLGFHARNTELISAFLLIRNNLTILEIIKLQGQGAHPMFKFGNRKPGSSQPLGFELTEKHLRDCDREKQKSSLPNLTIKRSFTARNTGDITVDIHGFYINDYPCEGHGFKVLNCEAFSMAPNTTKKIDIAFTSDLTLAKVTRLLILYTSLNFPVNYTLQTTIPSYYLGLCEHYVKRPQWEYYLKYLGPYIMAPLLVLIVLLSVMDADKIKRQMVNTLSNSCDSPQAVLDLRMIGQQIRNEIRSLKVEKEEKDKKLDARKPTKASTYQGDLQVKAKEFENPSLIPAVGKAKKKLGKRSSNEYSEEVLEKKQFESSKCQRVKVVTESKSEDKIPVKEVKKVCLHRKHSRSNHGCVYEEETSSTTTESSITNDDTEPKDKAKKPKTKIDVATDELYKERKIDPQVVDKSEKRKFLTKTANKSNKENENKTDQRNKSDNKRSNKNTKDRKEKQLLIKKQSLDKTNKRAQCRISPITCSNIWTENKATFSDVVARNDSLGVRSKPTVYVEPYKQTPVNLGPIGAERVDFWQDPEISSSSREDASNFNFPKDPLFATEVPQPFMEDFVQSNTVWRQNDIASLLDSNPIQMRDPWNRNLLNSNAYWENSFNSPSSSVQPNVSSQQTNYLWGSSSVWQPWTPEAPRTPTRMPPGFDLLHQRKNEEIPKREETYNPFTSTNIWTQQQNLQQTQPQPDVWDFSPGP